MLQTLDALFDGETLIPETPLNFANCQIFKIARQSRLVRKHRPISVRRK